MGRSQPNDEIALLDRNVEQLRADVAAYSPPADNVEQTTAWASVTQALNLFVLRWGQFKTALADDWYWGDDDESTLSTLRNQYNALRQQVLTETKARVTAGEIETPKEIDPDYEPPPTDLTVKELGVYALVGVLVLGVGYAILELKFGKLFRAARRAAGPASGGD